MTRKAILIVVLVAALATLGAVTVSADTVASPSARPAGVVVQGTGTLFARGSGVAYLRGSGHVVIQGYGLGSVWVKGAERIAAAGAGRRVDLPGGATLFVGWRGRVEVTGSAMALQLSGARIEFKATGRGTAILRGRGHYRIGNLEGSWSQAGAQVAYSEAG